MKTKKISLIVFFGGAAIKVLLIATLRLFNLSEIGTIIVKYDPLSIWLAEGMLALFWKQGIAPSMGLVIVYELIVVIAFAAQCLVLWLLCYEIWRFLQKRSLATGPDEG